MNDYIKREDALKAVCGGCNEQFDDEPCEPTACSVKERLLCIPSVDVVERKVGRWIDDGDCAICSKCMKAYTTGALYANYCPNCGAQMEVKP